MISHQRLSHRPSNVRVPALSRAMRVVNETLRYDLFMAHASVVNG